jgi:hypothetical protein
MNVLTTIRVSGRRLCPIVSVDKTPSPVADDRARYR